MIRFFAHTRRRGFSLVEMAIVLGIAGIMVGGIWQITRTVKQNVRLHSAADEVVQIVDGVRALYLGQAAISVGNASLGHFLPSLEAAGAVPQADLRPSLSSCQGVSAAFADNPWASDTTNSCGTLRLCGWAEGGSSDCSTVIATPVQAFAIEFTSLDYGSCVGLSQRINIDEPPGLIDLFINNTSAVAAGVGWPAPGGWALTKCVKASTNKIDFVYRLHPPS